MPAAPTDLTVTTTDGSPLVELEWSHTGTDLDRFEISKRPVGGTTWDRYVLATASQFGTAPNFSMNAVSAPDTEWVVVALDAAGDVSV